MKGTRRKPSSGDLFRFRVRTNEFFFGRVRFVYVVNDNAPMPGANLIYLYNFRSPTSEPDLDELSRAPLLLAPLWTNNMPWTKGYFEHISSWPDGDRARFGPACFYDELYKGLRDEFGRLTTTIVEPCGLWGLVSYRWIDDHVSDALHIPRVPDA